MSEYQRYEFMTHDRPLTQEQLAAVKKLSSHIDATSTHALVEYQWGDFKHDPIDVLHRFFDGFLYWANWGAPQLALRFSHGTLPPDLLTGYDLDEVVKFTPFPDYDILDIHFGELEAPDEWVEYELGPLIAVRDELLAGDRRSLYIVWLAYECMYSGDDEDAGFVDDVAAPDTGSLVPPVPPGLGTLTGAQQALAELLQVPPELLQAAAHHSGKSESASAADFAELVRSLPPERRDEYLIRLARNEPGLRHQLLNELRELNRDKSGAVPPTGKRIAFSALLAESQAIKAQWERERRERERQARLRHMRDIHDHQDKYWQQAEQAVQRRSGAGYDEALRILLEMRDVAAYFDETPAFQERFRAWVRPHLGRPTFVKRLRDQQFALPDVEV